MPQRRIGSNVASWMRSLFLRKQPAAVQAGLAAWLGEFRRAIGASARLDTLRVERSARDALGIDRAGVARQVFDEYYAFEPAIHGADLDRDARPASAAPVRTFTPARRSFRRADRAPSAH